MKPIHSYIANANIPDALLKLNEIAQNYWWAWSHEAKDVFQRIDRNLWEETNQNPVLLLNKVSQERFNELAQQADYISFLDLIYDKFQEYMNDKTWYSSNFSNRKETIAYFSMEYGIHESFPIYSGGLGVLSGDHLKSASDLGLPLVGIGLLYQQGYFRQHLTQNGWQNELYKTNDFYSMPLELMKNSNGSSIVLSVDLKDGKAYFQIWKLNVGRVALYLLDSNIEQNQNSEYRNITDQLYGGTRETRIQQEIMLGIGGMRALEALHINPSVVHINEGHAAFALLERAKMFMQKYHISFWAAKQLVQASSVFTTHTPVPAGNEAFTLDRIDAYMTNYYESLTLNREIFVKLGQQGEYNSEESFSMTVLGLKLTAYHNGVSKLHGDVSRKMWSYIWKDFPVDEVPIGHITNGIHTSSWLAREIAKLFDRYLSPRWRTDIDDDKIWNNVSNIPNEELWREKQRRRVRLVLFARSYLKKRQKSFLLADNVKSVNDILNPDALTIGFARRFATYKRATLLFTDMERLYSILKNPDYPVQVIIAGKAHPHDTAGKESIQTIIHKVREYGLEDRVIFLEDYDINMARMLVKGCDVWMNNPIRPLEASGTSGMKASLNGTLNMSILDGWWDEGYNGENGFAIGEGEEYSDTEQQHFIESNAIYELLEKVVVRMFYDRSRNQVPEKWVKYMKESIRTTAGRFSTTRMVKDYTNMFYLPAMDRYSALMNNNANSAVELDNWKTKVNNEWKSLEIFDIEASYNPHIKVGEKIYVKCKLKLGNLSPNDLDVQAYHGNLDQNGEIINGTFNSLRLNNQYDNVYEYSGEYSCVSSGNQGVTIRIVPTHPYLGSSAELYVCKWAN